MSYRDLRNLCEILRTVGYPRLVSIENFRNPNFPLVADVGRWLVNQYEPKADIPSSCDTEADRVLFIRTFAEFMLTKVQVKLNTKRLYQADGYAVKELIKVASVLYTAVKEAEQSSQSNSSYPGSRGSIEPLKVRIDTNELKETRALASHLVQKGVVLYDMLSKEVNLREARQVALSKAYEHMEVERLIKAAIETGAQEVKKLSTIVENVQSNLSNLEGKIEKKNAELERSQKRLQTLKKVRPAFMDEFEELQQELGGFYKEYVNRFRCLAFLQNQIEDMNRIESERKAEERLSKAEYGRNPNAVGDDFLYGGGKGAFNNYSGSDESSDEMDPLGLNTGVPPSTTGSSGRGGGGGGGGASSKFLNDSAMIGGFNSSHGGHRSNYGSMLGGDEDSEDESDMILVDGDNDNSDNELGSEDDEDDDELVGVQQHKHPAGSGAGSKMGRDGGSNRKNSSNVNGTGQYNEGSVISNGGIPTANGGKGYPVDNNNSNVNSRTRSMMGRPATISRKGMNGSSAGGGGSAGSEEDDF